MAMEFVEFVDNTPQVASLVADTADMRSREAAEMVREEWIRLITSGGRSGRLYNGHRASAPGEPPAARTSQLTSSIDLAGAEGPDGPDWGVGSPLDYALFLEIGTWKMAPRPSLEPAYRAVQQRILSDAFGREWL